jgi:hypothetical protein
MVMSNDDVSKGQPGAHRLWRFRLMKPISSDAWEKFLRSDRSKPEGPPSSSDTGSAITPGKPLRLWLKSPWEDYTSVRSVSGEPSLAYRRGAYFQKATIRAFPNSGGIGLLQSLSGIQHPNIAKLYDVYCCNNKIFTASEYLELSFVDLYFQSFPFDEWEIATIIAEVG